MAMVDDLIELLNHGGVVIQNLTIVHADGYNVHVGEDNRSVTHQAQHPEPRQLRQESVLVIPKPQHHAESIFESCGHFYYHCSCGAEPNTDRWEEHCRK